MTAAAESEGVKINTSAKDKSLTTRARTIQHSNNQINRTSDALSVKRAELLRIVKLLKASRSSADTAARMHYDDLVLRIQTALGLMKN